GQGRPHSERRCRGDASGDLDGAIQLLAGPSDLLDQTHSSRFVRGPFFPGQHEAHGIAPTGIAHEANGRATGGKEASATSPSANMVSLAATRTSADRRSSWPPNLVPP